MKIEVQWILGLLRHTLGAQAETLVRKRMENAEDAIVSGMKAKGLNETVGAGVCARDALFRLWKVVVKSGDVSDLIRDAQSPRVVAKIEAKFPHGAGSLNAIVQETTKAALTEVFGE